MALDDTSAAGGTIEYARGSHRWGRFPPLGQFHAPDDYRDALRQAAASVGASVELVPIEVPAGGCALHSGGPSHRSDLHPRSPPRPSPGPHSLSSAAPAPPTP